MAGGRLAVAMPPTGPGHLPIDLPQRAVVEFEVDAPGSELLPVLQQVLGGEDADPLAVAHSDRMKVKTGLGDIEFRTRDVAELLSPIRELHIVTYSGRDLPDDILHHYESEFAEDGLRRDATFGGGDGVLLMHRPGPAGLYAIVLRKRDRVTVIRTDGLPDLGALGSLALKTIGEAAQRAVFHKRH